MKNGPDNLDEMLAKASGASKEGGTVNPVSDQEYEHLLSMLHDEIETPANIHTLPIVAQEPSPEASPEINTEPLRAELEQPSRRAKRPSFRSMVKGFFDPKIWPSHLESLPESELHPKKIYIGLLNNIRKKDLIGYIDEWIVDNNCNRSSCAYQVVPFMGGFAFEVHEGGAGRGVLHSVLKSLDVVDEITVPSNDRYLRVAKKHDGFSVYLLNEFEKHEASDCIEFKDALSPVYKRNHGLMIAGIISALFASVFFLTTWFMVYTLYNKDKVAVFTPVSIELPSQQINKINDIAKREDAYLKSLIYANGKWKINLETVEVKKGTPAANSVPVAPEGGLQAPGVMPAPTMLPGQPQAQVDIQLIKLHKDLVQTLAEQKQ